MGDRIARARLVRDNQTGPFLPMGFDREQARFVLMARDAAVAGNVSMCNSFLEAAATIEPVNPADDLVTERLIRKLRYAACPHCLHPERIRLYIDYPPFPEDPQRWLPPEVRTTPPEVKNPQARRVLGRSPRRSPGR